MDTFEMELSSVYLHISFLLFYNEEEKGYQHFNTAMHCCVAHIITHEYLNQTKKITSIPQSDLRPAHILPASRNNLDGLRMAPIIGIWGE